MGHPQGCSTGLGKEVARAALERGDKVIATARNTSKLEDLKSLDALTNTDVASSTTVCSTVADTPVKMDAEGRVPKLEEKTMAARYAPPPVLFSHS